jgi:hypothetical protein
MGENENFRNHPGNKNVLQNGSRKVSEFSFIFTFWENEKGVFVPTLGKTA